MVKREGATRNHKKNTDISWERTVTDSGSFEAKRNPEPWKIEVAGIERSKRKRSSRKEERIRVRKSKLYAGHQPKENEASTTTTKRYKEFRQDIKIRPYPYEGGSLGARRERRSKALTSMNGGPRFQRQKDCRNHRKDCLWEKP